MTEGFICGSYVRVTSATTYLAVVCEVDLDAGELVVLPDGAPDEEEYRVRIAARCAELHVSERTPSRSERAPRRGHPERASAGNGRAATLAAWERELMTDAEIREWDEAERATAR